MNSENKRIFLSPPHMGGEEIEFVQKAFESNFIAPLGPMVDAFEREFGEYVGLRHCAAVSSGTAAIHLALRHLFQTSDSRALTPDHRPEVSRVGDDGRRRTKGRGRREKTDVRGPMYFRGMVSMREMLNF
ncbi:MAG: DegT/DnrJ/EryC1/StrS family aminotransferase [Desulfatiglandaceae bacterium]